MEMEMKVEKLHLRVGVCCQFSFQGTNPLAFPPLFDLAMLMRSSLVLWEKASIEGRLEKKQVNRRRNSLWRRVIEFHPSVPPHPRETPLARLLGGCDHATLRGGRQAGVLITDSHSRL